MRQKKPVPKNSLSKDIQNGKEDSLRIDAKLESERSSRDGTIQYHQHFLPQPEWKVEDGKTYIGNKANATIAEPERAPKNRLVLASFTLAALCAWNPTWWITTR
jgi:hypothetical protein